MVAYFTARAASGGRPASWRAATLSAAAAGLATWLLPLAALAAGPSFDCAAAAGEVERAICDDETLAELDRELDRVYRATTGALAGDALADVQAGQADWIASRDACAGEARATCIRDHYAMRIHDLLELAPVTGDAVGAALGPFLWTCEGVPDPVSSVFVNVAEPLVSLRWGDEAAVLPIAISASGARYAIEETPADPIAEFWTRGDFAMFTPPGGARVDCTPAEGN